MSIVDVKVVVVTFEVTIMVVVAVTDATGYLESRMIRLGRMSPRGALGCMAQVSRHWQLPQQPGEQ